MKRALPFLALLLVSFWGCGKPRHRVLNDRQSLNGGGNGWSNSGSETVNATLVLFGAPPCSNCHRDFPEIQRLLDSVPAADKRNLRVMLFVETGPGWRDPPSLQIAIGYRDSLRLQFEPHADGVDSHGGPSFETYTKYTQIPLAFMGLPAAVILNAQGAVIDIYPAGGTTFVPRKIAHTAVQRSQQASPQ